MRICQLCGYQAQPSNGTGQSCPVCGTDYAFLLAKEHANQRRTIHTDNQVCPAARPARGQVLHECLDPSLRSLLQLLPQKSDRKRKERDIMHSACVLNYEQAGAGETNPEAVYLRPRADAAMLALKGRYDTRPRDRKPTSMSALHRLAHPLAGYDSTEALDPEARRQRRASIQRILGTYRATDNESDEQPQANMRSPDGPGGRAWASSSDKRRNNRGRKAVQGMWKPLETPKGRGYLHRRSRARAFAAYSTGKQCDEAPQSCAASRRRDMPASTERPRRLRENSRNSTSSLAARRVHPTRGSRQPKPPRRKRVATMRSINGWVREADPEAARRCPRLEEQALASASAARQPSPDAASRTCGTDQATGIGPFFREADRTFLTAIDTGCAPSPTCGNRARGREEPPGANGGTRRLRRLKRPERDRADHTGTWDKRSGRVMTRGGCRRALNSKNVSSAVKMRVAATPTGVRGMLGPGSGVVSFGGHPREDNVDSTGGRQGYNVYGNPGDRSAHEVGNLHSPKDRCIAVTEVALQGSRAAYQRLITPETPVTLADEDAGGAPGYDPLKSSTAGSRAAEDNSPRPGIRTRRVSVGQLLRAGGGAVPHPATIAEEFQGSRTMGKADPSEDESHELIGCAPTVVSGVDPETKPSREQALHRTLPPPSPGEQSNVRFLSSLVSDHVNSPDRAVTPTSSLKVTIRRRGKRRSAEGEPSGRMLRLDQSPMAVAGAWGGEAETSRGLEVQRPGGGVCCPGAPPREPQSSINADQLDRKTRNGVGRGLSSQAVPLPLLFVGTGAAFKPEAAHGSH